MKRPELGVTLTKPHCWSLTQFSKRVFVGADTLVLANTDDLFERELSAAPAPAGLTASIPESLCVSLQCKRTASCRGCFRAGSFDGGDQGFLDMCFSSWATTATRQHLPCIYNLSSISVCSYLPALKAFGANAKVVHFLGRIKPWNYTYDPKTKSVKSESHDPTMTHPESLSLGWGTFTTCAHPAAAPGLISDPHPHLRVEDVSEPCHIVPRGHPGYGTAFCILRKRKERWEQGQADDMGADSFANIKRKLAAYLQ